jgi:alkylhydroperoxidase family enzyme
VYASARHQGLTDEMVAAIPEFETSPLFTPAEKAAIRLADAMSGDHKHADFDAIFAELRNHYTQAQIVELGWRASVFIGYGRLVYALGVDAIGASCAIPEHREEQSA